MQAECSICMEHFETSEAISASHCGHVFHEACITRWLGQGVVRSVGYCPQCRAIVNRVGLTRLFFTHSSSTDVKQREIDELQARIARDNKRIVTLTDDCRRKEEEIEKLTADFQNNQYSVVALSAECRQKRATIERLTCDSRRQASKIDELTADCRQKDEMNERIEELTEASEQKDATIATLNQSNQKRADLIVEQAERLNLLTKALERMEALNEQKKRAHEKTIAGLEAKAKTLELNSAKSEDTNASLTMLTRTQGCSLADHVSRVTELTRTLEDKEKTVTSLHETVKTLELKWKTSEETKTALIGKHSALTKRCQLLEAQVDAQGEGDQVRVERAGQLNKSNFARKLDRLWESMCERIVDHPRLTHATPLVAVEKAFDSKLVQLASRVAQVSKKCMRRFKASKGDTPSGAQ